MDIKKRLEDFNLKRSHRYMINRDILFELCYRLDIDLFVPRNQYTNAHLATKINLKVIENGYSEIILWDEGRKFWFLGEMWKIVKGKYIKDLKK
jgi:hypothetical protein